MKFKKNDIVIECDNFTKNVWEREGFVPFDEEPEEISYTEMKRLAKENGINSQGMKKEELFEAIKSYI